jgi:phage shock protein A
MAMKRKMIDWLIGDRASRVLIALWHWLWGMPIESGGKISVEVAQESLQSMRESVNQLTESVAKLIAAYQIAKTKYDSKQKEFQQAEKQATLAHQAGNPEAARLAMTKAVLIEQLLPQLAEQVAYAEKTVQAAQEKLSRERHKLEQCQIQMQNLKALSEVNEALKSITQINSTLQVGSARSQFESAQSAIQRRHLQINAHAELSEDPQEKLAADLEHLTLDDEIARRLQQIENISKP